MPYTLEEIASKELDTLFQGAVFLHAGDREAAEGLLVRTLAQASRGFGARDREISAVEWLESRLVREFVHGSGADRDGRSIRNYDPSANSVASVRESVVHCAAEVPFLARGVLWLVLFRRWGYAQAQRVLALDPESFETMLTYRAALSRGISTRSRISRGAER